MQHLMHQFKYKGNKDLGRQLGRIMGLALKKADRFNGIDGLVPLPLFPSKERKRGFNQSVVLCEGISEILSVPVYKNVVSRPQPTETQTKKGRIERWRNIEGKFFLDEPGQIADKHLLLVDDVITTGSTLEACGNELIKSENTRLSIATLTIATR